MIPHHHGSWEVEVLFENLKRRDRRGERWRASDEAAELRAELSTNEPFEILLNHLRRNKARDSYYAIDLCFMHVWQSLLQEPPHLRLSALQHPDRRQSCEECVTYILATQSLWLPLFLYHERSRFLLILFAVSLGRDYKVLDCLRCDPVTEEKMIHPKGAISRARKWRDNALRDLIRIQIAVHASGRIHTSIRSLLKMSNWKAWISAREYDAWKARKKSLVRSAEAPGPAVPHLRLINSWSQIAWAYLARGNKGGSETLWNGFLALGDALIGHEETDDSNRVYKFQLARLNLHHPTNPNPDPLLKYLKSEGKIDLTTDAPGRGLYEAELKWLRQMLRYSGRQGDAEWLDDAYEKAVEESVAQSQMIRKADKSNGSPKPAVFPEHEWMADREGDPAALPDDDPESPFDDHPRTWDDRTSGTESYDWDKANDERLDIQPKRDQDARKSTTTSPPPTDDGLNELMRWSANSASAKISQRRAPRTRNTDRAFRWVVSTPSENPPPAPAQEEFQSFYRWVETTPNSNSPPPAPAQENEVQEDQATDPRQNYSPF